MSYRVTCHEKYKLNEILVRVFFIWLNRPPPPQPSIGPGPLLSRFLYHTQRHPAVGRTPLDVAEAFTWYLISHNTHNRHPCRRWDSNPQSYQASGHRPPGYCDRNFSFYMRCFLIWCPTEPCYCCHSTFCYLSYVFHFVDSRGLLTRCMLVTIFA